MSILWLVGFILAVMCWVARSENENIPENKRISMMVKADLKAERKRGDIFTQGRRGNYRWSK